MSPIFKINDAMKNRMIYINGSAVKYLEESSMEGRTNVYFIGDDDAVAVDADLESVAAMLHESLQR